MEKQAIILMCSHKPAFVPLDSIYLPVQVGSFGKERIHGFASDAEGEHISDKNSHYCELTGLYWAWKNLQQSPDQYLGLVHYRRFFSNGSFFGRKQDRIAGAGDIGRLLKNTDVVLPKQRHYYIETNYNQYVHAHHREDLDKTREILGERCPEYLRAFDQSMAKTHGHRFNMFIMRRDIADRYCAWLFDILQQLEARLNIEAYSAYNQRVFGFVGERLLDVWIMTNQIPYCEAPYVFMEKQNWIVKAGRFCQRKLKGIRKDAE